MYYEINVSKLDDRSKTYKHYFATAPRSLDYYRDAVRMLKEFMVLFPAPEYELTVNYNPESFHGYSAEEFLSEWDNEEKIE